MQASIALQLGLVTDPAMSSQRLSAVVHRLRKPHPHDETGTWG